MSEHKEPTIAERLDYIKICEEAIKYHQEQNRHSRGKAELRASDKEKKEYYEALAAYNNKQRYYYECLKDMIVRDLVQDSEFLAYTSQFSEEIDAKAYYEPDKKILIK